jgi:CBS domain-containing protein
VWGFNKDFARASKFAARSGQVVAYAMIALGAGTALMSYQPLGGPVGGLWLAFIGWFILSAAKQSQAQAEARGALEGLSVADIMTPDLQTVGREISLEDYAREMVRTGRRSHLVVAGTQLVGLVTAEALNSVPQQDWDVTSVQAVMLPKEKLHWAAPEEPALSLLDRMRTVGMQQMPVITGGSVVGIVTRDSILRVLQSRHAVGSIAGR